MTVYAKALVEKKKIVLTLKFYPLGFLKAI